MDLKADLCIRLEGVKNEVLARDADYKIECHLWLLPHTFMSNNPDQSHFSAVFQSYQSTLLIRAQIIFKKVSKLKLTSKRWHLEALKLHFLAEGQKTLAACCVDRMVNCFLVKVNQNKKYEPRRPSSRCCAAKVSGAGVVIHPQLVAPKLTMKMWLTTNIPYCLG